MEQRELEARKAEAKKKHRYKLAAMTPKENSTQMKL